MKFYFRQLIYNWRLTGFVGKNADWFLGYSSITKLHNISTYEQNVFNNLDTFTKSPNYDEIVNTVQFLKEKKI
jgi:hypothetical protein